MACRLHNTHARPSRPLPPGLPEPRNRRDEKAEQRVSGRSQREYGATRALVRGSRSAERVTRPVSTPKLPSSEPLGSRSRSAMVVRTRRSSSLRDSPEPQQGLLNARATKPSGSNGRAHPRQPLITSNTARRRQGPQTPRPATGAPTPAFSPERVHNYVHFAGIYKKFLNSLFQTLYKVWRER
jgi:hypothetical protein